MAGFWKMPQYVLSSKELSIYEKCVLCVIAGLCSQHGKCTASNKTLAQFCGISKDTVIRCIKTLQTMAIIKCKYAVESRNTARTITMNKSCGIYVEFGVANSQGVATSNRNQSLRATNLVADSHPNILNNRYKDNRCPLPPEIEAKRYWNDDQWNEYQELNRLSAQETELKIEMAEWRESELQKQNGGN